MGFWGVASLAAVFAALNCAGDAAAKDRRFLLALGVYAVSATTWIEVFRRHDVPVAKVGALYAVFSCVGTTALGTLLFGERLSPRGWVGVGLGIAAIALIAAEEYGGG